MTPPPATAAGRLALRSSAPARERHGAPVRSRRAASGVGIAQRRRPSGPARPTAADQAPAIIFAPPATDATQPARKAEAIAPARPAILGSGRALIVGFAILLAGLVTLEGALTEANSGLGATVQEITRLERENAVLRSTVSSLSSDQRVVAEAKRMGFVEPPVGSSRFMAVSLANSEKALAMMVPATQAASLAGAGASGTAPAPSVGGLVQQASAAGPAGAIAAAPSPTGVSGVPAAPTSSSGAGATVSGGVPQAASPPVTTAAVPYGGAAPTHG